jgi:hypothetical protein
MRWRWPDPEPDSPWYDLFGIACFVLYALGTVLVGGIFFRLVHWFFGLLEH